MSELKRPSIKARKMMSAVAAIHPARRDREIDELDKVYTRLMLGEKLMNMRAPTTASVPKVAAPTITRQLQRRIDRARAKQAKLKARIDAARQMG
tara:strand:- start:211 stop:495 length:285 start_codon:yes stop_codon:yes gene_type:complete